MSAYYNEHDPKTAAWLRGLIAAGLIADGEVDTRSIVDVRPADVRGFAQCHFFAGIGGWSYALRLAGWPDDRAVWTGSCPCQPWSMAGDGQGANDPRHLWPAWFRLIEVCRPATIFGEQVASLDGLYWLDLVYRDMEAEDYAVGAVDLSSACIGAPHIRSRVWFVADSGHAERRPLDRARGRMARQHAIFQGQETTSQPGECCALDDTERERTKRGSGSEGCAEREASCGREDERSRELQALDAGAADQLGDPYRERLQAGWTEPHGTDGRITGRAIESASTLHGFWRVAEWIPCRDGKARPVEPCTFPLAHGVPARVGRLRGYGNAIVPQVAAEFIRAYCER